ncbi:MAG TPA: HAMP domain-containing sensor histidine kinase [Solirubrobacteraceae bacterium]
MTEEHKPRKYLPLTYRVVGVNAILLVATVVVTVLVLAPRKFESVEFNELAVLLAALVLVTAANFIVLRWIVRPLEALTSLARRVDLSRPGERMPAAQATSEAGELALTFNEMLERLEAERRDATGRVLAAQESERLRIALELHDQVGQELTAVLLGLARLNGQVDPPLRDQVTDVQEAVRASLEEVRRIALELRPEALDDLGLMSALAVLCERFAERAGIHVGHQFDLRLPPLQPEQELVVYRVVQEALTNVARHSGADCAELSLRRHDGELIVTVTDRGRGFGRQVEAGTGIQGMRERAGLIGATLDVGPNNGGGGCTVRLRLATEQSTTTR